LGITLRKNQLHRCEWRLVDYEKRMKNIGQSPHEDKTLRLHMEGVSGFNGDVSLGTFIEKLNALKDALTEADKLVSGGEQKKKEFLVAELRHSSPAMVGLSEFGIEADSNGDNSVQKFFVNFLQRVSKREKIAAERYAKLINKLKALANGAGSKYQTLWIDGVGLPTVVFDREMREALDSALPSIKKSVGSIKGIVRKYSSINKNQKYFRLILPANGREVKCVFREELLSQAAAAVEKNVTIEGNLSYYGDTFWPFEVKVKSIIVHGDDSELPKLSELYGVAPNATGDLSTDDYIRKIRNEW